MSKRIEVFPESLAAAYLPADHADSFRIVADGPLTLTPDDLMVKFWTDLPGWVSALFRVRNFLVRIVGLETGGRDRSAMERCIREGGSYGVMKIVAKNEHETVCLLADKHLDAYLSVYTGDREVVGTTVVRFHNRLGRVYFFFIRPFHNIIVPTMLRRAARGK